MPKYLQQQRNQNGLLTILVGTISLDQSTAVVTKQLEHSPPAAMTGTGLTGAGLAIFRLDHRSGGWKICSVI